MELRAKQGEKKSGHEETLNKGTFWRVTVLETDTGFAWQGAMKKTRQMPRFLPCAAATWEDLYYNFGHTVRTLKIPVDAQNLVKGLFKPKWIHCTPAMVSGLASHIGSVKELLYSIPIQQHFSG